MPEKVTIIEVALRAGVSTATAGRVLGGYGYSSEENKEKVRKAAIELGYRPNLLARSLITGTTKTIGVVAGDVQSPFYASILRGISDVARAEGFGVVVTNSDEIPEREKRSTQLLLEKRVDGLIIAPCDTSSAEHLRAAVRDGHQIVQIDRLVRDLATDSVTVKNCAAVERCISDLISSGHRHIAMVGELESWDGGDLDTFLTTLSQGLIDPETLYPSWQRLYGFVQAHWNAGLRISRELIVRVGSYSVEAARQRTSALFSGKGARPTAVFTADGLMSAGVMATLTEREVNIPEDVSLICFDDLDWMSFIKPGITAVAQPLTELGRTAAKLLLERLSGFEGPPRHARLDPTLVTRGSVAPPRTDSKHL